ncbi:hypothetical protein [Enterococcus sp. AZ072]|uniref:hypothetical protein n=1 Tax=unclassified Enterococcus TaxID=2608891 RepID=UPI003D280D7D
MDETKRQYLILVFSKFGKFAATSIVTIYSILASSKIIFKRLQEITIFGDMTIIDKGTTAGGKLVQQTIPITDFLIGIISLIITIYLVAFGAKFIYQIQITGTINFKKEVSKGVLILMFIAFICLVDKEDFSPALPIIYSWVSLLILIEILNMEIVIIQKKICFGSTFEEFYNFDRAITRDVNNYLSPKWEQWLVPQRIENNSVAYAVKETDMTNNTTQIIWHSNRPNESINIVFRLKYTPFAISLHKDIGNYSEYGELASAAPAVKERTEKDE